jgi:hypothetical protein
MRCKQIRCERVKRQTSLKGQNAQNSVDSARHRRLVEPNYFFSFHTSSFLGAA